jgi:hypothetical protein
MDTEQAIDLVNEIAGARIRPSCRFEKRRMDGKAGGADIAVFIRLEFRSPKNPRWEARGETRKQERADLKFGATKQAGKARSADPKVERIQSNGRNAYTRRNYEQTYALRGEFLISVWPA